MASASNPSPDTSSSKARETPWRRYGWIVAGLVIAACVVIVLAPAASSNPDGLDRVSGDEGFDDQAEDPRYEWLPDYTVPGVDGEWASLVLAGLIGVGIVFVLTAGIGAVVRRSQRQQAP